MWPNTSGGRRRPALRTGLAAVREIGEATWAAIAAAGAAGPFAGLADFCARTRLAPEVVRNLIRAGACDGWGERRALLWQLGDLDLRPDALPLAPGCTPADLPPKFRTQVLAEAQPV